MHTSAICAHQLPNQSIAFPIFEWAVPRFLIGKEMPDLYLWYQFLASKTTQSRFQSPPPADATDEADYYFQ
jgi:hypothetical protein